MNKHRKTFSDLGFLPLWASLHIAGGCSGTAGTTVVTRPAPKTPVALRAGGSTFVAPLMEKWLEPFAAASGITVDYRASGSGEGQKGVVERSLAIGCSDAVLSDETLQRAREMGGEMLHIPIAVGAVAVAYNLPEVAAPLRFSRAVLADVYLGVVVKWNDPRLRALNPGAALPDREILVVHRKDKSGTTAVFTEALAKFNPDWKTKVGVGGQVKWPCGKGANRNEGIAGLVRRNSGAVGYLEYSYAKINKLQIAAVENREGVFVLPTQANVTNALAASLPEIPPDLRYSLTNAPGANSYPICATTWAIFYRSQRGERGRAAVTFLQWATTVGQRYATEELGYAPLPKDLVDRIDECLQRVQISADVE